MGYHATEQPLVAFEPIPIADTFVTGMLPIEELGGLLYATFYADRRDASGGIERAIVVRLLLTGETYERCRRISEASISSIRSEAKSRLD